MNSICKKFKKVVSSVVLTCGMVCSGGFANAGLFGKSFDINILKDTCKTAAEDMSLSLSGNFKRLRKSGGVYERFTQKDIVDRFLCVALPSRFNDELWKEYCTCRCKEDIREKFIDEKKSKDGPSSFYNLVNICSDRVKKMSRFVNFH